MSTGDGHLTIRVPADGDLQPRWEGQGYTITINGTTWRGVLTSVRLDGLGHELELQLDLRHYDAPSRTRNHCRICGTVSISAVCATCTASGEILAESGISPITDTKQRQTRRIQGR